MTSLILSRNSKIAPTPWHVSHGNGFSVGYTCHMAAMHWAFMTLGKTQQQANTLVGRMAVAHCPGCKSTGIHGSLQPRVYGELFGKHAQRITSRNDLQRQVDVGDVLITDNPVWPAHSMILRQKRGPNHITVRGFNNFGTLGTGQRDHYDPVSHNITKDKYWADPNGKFGHSIGVDLYVIKHEQYMSVIRTLGNRF